MREERQLPVAALDGQALAALGAAGVQHGTAATGFHAHAKAVGTLAAGNGRLVGAFHGRSTKRTTSEGTCPTGSRPGRAPALFAAGGGPAARRNLLTDRIRKSPSFQQVFSALSNSYAPSPGT